MNREKINEELLLAGEECLPEDAVVETIKSGPFKGLPTLKPCGDYGYWLKEENKS